MTRSHRQEALSRAYVLTVAAQAGVSWARADQDYGIDLSLRLIAAYERRRRDTGIQLDVQLKSTTRASVTDKSVLFDLDVEAYNDLRSEESPCPRILIVFVMPADEAAWLSQTTEEMTLRHCAYWISLKGFPGTTAKRTIRITIPLTNVFSVDALTQMLQRIRERKDP